MIMRCPKCGYPVSHKSLRSVPANRRYWALVTLGAQALGYVDPEDLHEAIAFKLLRLPDDPLTGSPRRRSTATLNTAEFADYSERVEWLLREFGADLTGWEHLAERA